MFFINDQSDITLATRMAVVALSAQPSYPAFDVDEDGVGIRWTKWVQRLERNVFTGHGIRNNGQKKALLLCLAGDAVNDIYDALPVSQEPAATFERTVEALTDHFNPRQNREYHRYVFRPGPDFPIGRPGKCRGPRAFRGLAPQVKNKNKTKNKHGSQPPLKEERAREEPRTELRCSIN